MLIVLGLCLGSFANALIWRLHEQEKRAGNKRNKSSQLSILNGRSMCPDCRHKLVPIDLIPVVSWLMLKGKCRYCHKSISLQYPLIEILAVLLFALSYYYWPFSLHGYGLAAFIAWLIIVIGFVALTVLDARWYWLPDRIVYPLIAIALTYIILISFSTQRFTANITGSLIGIAIIAGLYYLLYKLSKGKWMGLGDAKLGIVIGILVGGPFHSLLVLFLSATTGSIAALPFLITGKLKRNSLLPFGPFLILATIITVLFGASIIHWYQNLYI
ncbi:MAG TPA: prepilin peptidase [Candidatus Saccharimonadales bacterium]|nr:prepilin peptidase [Candidatus Saccharimonadales bacterium]